VTPSGSLVVGSGCPTGPCWPPPPPPPPAGIGVMEAVVGAVAAAVVEGVTGFEVAGGIAGPVVVAGIVCL
jgi:hypothetical protein